MAAVAARAVRPWLRRSALALLALAAVSSSVRAPVPVPSTPVRGSKASAGRTVAKATKEPKPPQKPPQNSSSARVKQLKRHIMVELSALSPKALRAMQSAFIPELSYRHTHTIGDHLVRIVIQHVPAVAAWRLLQLSGPSLLVEVCHWLSIKVLRQPWVAAIQEAAPKDLRRMLEALGFESLLNHWGRKSRTWLVPQIIQICDADEEKRQLLVSMLPRHALRAADESLSDPHPRKCPQLVQWEVARMFVAETPLSQAASRLPGVPTLASNKLVPGDPRIPLLLLSKLERLVNIGFIALERISGLLRWSKESTEIKGRPLLAIVGILQRRMLPEHLEMLSRMSDAGFREYIFEAVYNCDQLAVRLVQRLREWDGVARLEVWRTCMNTSGHRKKTTMIHDLEHMLAGMPLHRIPLLLRCNDASFDYAILEYLAVLASPTSPIRPQSFLPPKRRVAPAAAGSVSRRYSQEELHAAARMAAAGKSTRHQHQ
mmetsp:Transcript_123728/g.357893  ORF Transcript_123728/g.357893 Transcript_123728/m.357893 type:complete len:487 (-) Transcript_123728:82-1542(-)